MMITNKVGDNWMDALPKITLRELTINDVEDRYHTLITGKGEVNIVDNRIIKL